MDTMALAIAGVAALAIVLIAVGVATSGGSGISDRLERYAAKPTAAAKAGSSGKGGVAELIAQSQALNSLNRVVEQRDFGANLARDIARADLKLKPSEFLLIWAASIVGIPIAMFLLSAFLPALGNPLFLLVGALVGFLLPRFWLARRKNGRLGAFNKQLPDTITLIANALRAGSSFLQAIELVVRESRPPISTEFGRVIREVNLGLPVRPGPREHGPPRPLGRPRADGDRHQHPAPGRWQPRRDPRFDRLHDPRTRPHQGRDPDPHRAAAPVGLRRGRPADRPGRSSCSSPHRASWSPCSPIRPRSSASRPASSSC